MIAEGLHEFKGTYIILFKNNKPSDCRIFVTIHPFILASEFYNIGKIIKSMVMNDAWTWTGVWADGRTSRDD